MSSQSVIAMDSEVSPRVGTKLSAGSTTVELYASAKLPTQHGDFSIFVFRNNIDNLEHVALVRGENLAGAENVPVRVHSECLTGDVMGSLRCDCGQQLDSSMARVAKEGGAVVYLRQEGRGIGLVEKLKAYNLQDDGMDTYQANEALGHQRDSRSFDVAAAILRDLGWSKVRLMTNNPQKVSSLTEEGIEVTEIVPIVFAANAHNEAYLKAKRQEEAR